MIVTELGGGILRLSEAEVSEAERSHFYLVLGERRACLIDGGWGLGEGLPQGLLGGRDLFAVATHSHFDHIGHLYKVAERWGHEAEAAIFADPTPTATQAAPYLKGRPVLADGGVLWPLVQRPCPLTGFVEEGSMIDLGGRRLEVLHTPGHSPGSISLLDGQSGTLFCGDVLLEGHIYDDIPGADRAVLRDSHRRLAGVAFDRVCGGHGGVMTRKAALARMARYAAG